MKKDLKPNPGVEPDFDENTFASRITAAVLAPVFFNIGIWVCFNLCSRRNWIISSLLSQPHLKSAWVGFLILIAVPAIIGYRLGIEKSSVLLGHFFYTHVEAKRSLQKTLLTWLGFIAIFYFLDGVVFKA